VEATSAPRPHGVRIFKPRRLLAAFSDERLVEHVRKGDEAAFEALYDRHSAGILGFCRHMLRSAGDAEDAVQATFIAAHADIQRHGERDLHVKAWLYTIARNRCLSMLRAQREQPAHEAIELVTDNLEHDVHQRADLRALLADVSKLPDDQREALVLAEVGDFSHADIAAVIGCEVAKVKSLVFQARTALIDRRLARETPCTEIREQIATLRGGALRRSHLRHHIESCPGCAQFREDVRRQRAMLGLALPVIPSAALRAHVLGAIGMGGGSTAAGLTAGGGGLFVAAQSGAAKLAIAALIAVAGGGAAVVTTHGMPIIGHSHDAAATSPSQAGSGANGKAVRSGAAAAGANGYVAHTATGTSHRHLRSASGTEHGFTPVQGGSNGARARQFAATRGQGSHSGITTTHTSSSKAHTQHAPVAKGRVTHTTSTHVTESPQATQKTHTTPSTSGSTRQTQSTPTTTTTPTQTQSTPATGRSGNGNGNGNGVGGVNNAKRPLATG
jgi:RNA polymerase sigma factor (sigma-70 family)